MPQQREPGPGAGVGADPGTIGAGLIAFGSLGPVLLSLDVIGLVPGMLCWAVAALGMGIVSPTLSTQLLSLAPSASRVG